jgi:hypothetical protein
MWVMAVSIDGGLINSTIVKANELDLSRYETEKNSSVPARN